jgi:hypothetical protein
MEVTIINKEKYISSDILFVKAPVYCKLSRTAREKAVSLWSYKAIVPKYLNVYEHAINGIGVWE